MSKKSCKSLFELIAICCGILAIVAMFIFTGAKLTSEGLLESEASIKLFGLVFGGATLYTSTGDIEVNLDTTGGLSYLGLISFIVLVLGIILIALPFFKNNLKTDLLGYLLLIVAGILMFFVLKAGSDIEFKGATQEFKKMYEEFSLGIGVYLYSILAILGGVVGFAKKFLKK